MYEHDDPRPAEPGELAAALARLDAQLGALATQTAWLVERQRRVEELMDEMTPIARAVMAAGGEKLGALEEKGWFSFGREALRVLERVVETTEEDDLRQLGDNIVNILDTVRNLTQADVLSLANEATDALHEADGAEPMGVLGVMRASRDEDVQRGMAVAMGILRRIGRASRDVDSQRERARRPTRHAHKVSRLSERTAPRRAAPQALARPSCETVAAAPADLVIPGYGLSPDGFLLDPAAWTPEFAVAMAAAVGAPALTEAHFALLQAARKDHAETGTSPNIRRLTAISGLGTREVYTLFPKAPGKTCARVAGLPKPAGCI